MIGSFFIYRILILMVFPQVVWVLSVLADIEPPEATVGNLLKTIQKIKTSVDVSAEQKKNNLELSKFSLNFLDISEISKKTLGRHWKKRSPKEQREFAALLGQLFKKVAFPGSSKFFSELKITYEKNLVKDGLATTTILVRHQKEGEIEIDFVMHEVSGKWKVIEVILDGVSMRNSLRSQFYKIISTTGYSDLVQRMNKKLKGGKE